MEATHCQIVMVRPEGYVHALAFQEVAETLMHALQRMGAPARISTNLVDSRAVNIVLGWHLLSEDAMAQLPEQTVLYNMEQLDEQNRALLARLLVLGNRFEIWDYSRRNLEILLRSGFHGSLKHAPVGFVEELSRIPKLSEQDIDVLFYGSINERRAKVLEGIRSQGLRVEAVFGVYGAERDALIARSKVILNMHYYDSSIFEIVRVSYLLANRKAVVAECHSGTDVDPILRQAVRAVSYPDLVEACVDLVRDDRARSELEERGCSIFSAQREEEILGAILGGGEDSPAASEAIQPPTTIEMSATKRYVIYGPIWHHRSGGLMALYNLQKALIRKGYDCIYYCFGSESVALTEITDYDVVIYPEIVVGNPLKAKNVVRWLLNSPGVCGGDGVYGKNDMIFCYLPKFHFPNMKGYLCISIYDENLKNLNYPRSFDCIWVYKGKSKKRIPIEGVEIRLDWPKSKPELIKLLQHCKTLYSYDDTTALATEAKMCGCEVKLINDDGSIVPYPFSTEEEEYFAKSSDQLDEFIQITQANHG